MTVATHASALSPRENKRGKLDVVWRLRMRRLLMRRGNHEWILDILEDISEYLRLNSLMDARIALDDFKSVLIQSLNTNQADDESTKRNEYADQSGSLGN